MIDFNNKGFFKLKQNNEYAERVAALLLGLLHQVVKLEDSYPPPQQIPAIPNDPTYSSPDNHHPIPYQPNTKIPTLLGIPLIKRPEIRSRHYHHRVECPDCHDNHQNNKHHALKNLHETFQNHISLDS